MRHSFANHLEKCSNNHSLNEQRLVAKTTHVGPTINSVETITIDHPSETLVEPRVPNTLVERITSPPSPQNGPTRNPQTVSSYNSSSTIIHQPRAPQSSEITHLQVARQGSASLPINIPSHSPIPSHQLRYTPSQSRMSQTLRLPSSLPQTLTVSPIQIPSPTSTRPMHSSQPANLRHSQPALNQIKVEFPPFRPPLPYVIDDDITMEKEVDAKKKHASPRVYDVDAANIHSNLIILCIDL
jgi:hypothetical protein